MAVENILVVWLQCGMRIVRGHASRRFPGDQDLMSRSEARNLAACGLVRIVGGKNDVPEVEGVKG